MSRALVIRRYGDQEIAGAIVDGMTKNVIRLDDGELAAVKAELARLRAQDGLRSYGDEIRFETACKALALKYSTKPHGRAYNAILCAWALLWMGVFAAYERLSAWNRG